MYPANHNYEYKPNNLKNNNYNPLDNQKQCSCGEELTCMAGIFKKLIKLTLTKIQRYNYWLRDSCEQKYIREYITETKLFLFQKL